MKKTKLSHSINSMKVGQRIISNEEERLVARIEPEEAENFADVETYAIDICSSYNNTVGKSINPESIPDLLEALKEVKRAIERYNIQDYFNEYTINSAIEKAKI